jgi:aryl-alcohol dehydrogenase-like predicted oxidoreductase
MGMPYHRLESTGPQLNVLSFGSWVTLGEPVGFDGAVVSMAIAREAGLNVFGNAENYRADHLEPAGVGPAHREVSRCTTGRQPREPAGTRARTR